MAQALLFDVGDVLMLSNWAVLDDLQKATGRPLRGRGPLDPAGDPDWLRYLAGDIPLDTYWTNKAQAAGYTGFLDLWRSMSYELQGDVFAADALQLVADARAAGVKVGILSNDLVGSAGREWVDSRPELSGFDVFVDCTEFGTRKPSPEPYLRAIADFGLPPDDIVFLDDMPYCIEGARAVGMIGVHVDPTARTHAFNTARELVGIAPRSWGRRHVDAAETAYRSQNLEAIMTLFHPEVVIYWNGRKVASGLAEARRFHIDRLGFGSIRRNDYRLRKTLRAEHGDTICVEWESSYRLDDGTRVESRAGEFWTMRHDLLIEWHAYKGES